MADFIEGKRPVIEALRTHVPLKYILMADNLSQGDSLVRDIQRKAKTWTYLLRRCRRRSSTRFPSAVATRASWLRRLRSTM
ncbi:MAG: hypothetical protein ACLUW6_10400 [Coriobacteriaceae bacterium]